MIAFYGLFAAIKNCKNVESWVFFFLAIGLRLSVNTNAEQVLSVSTSAEEAEELWDLGAGYG